MDSEMKNDIESFDDDIHPPFKRVASENEQGAIIYKVPPKTSQYRGVSKTGLLWQARYTSHGVTHQIGRYDTEFQAHEAYEAFVVENEKKEKIANFGEKLIQIVAHSEHIQDATKVKLLLFLFDLKKNPQESQTLRMINVWFNSGFEQTKLFHECIEKLVV